MAEEISWPPTSPKAALLSSPSGRKRYNDDMQRSPIKRSRTTPSLLERLRAARADNDYFDGMNDEGGEGEEDEETLKLQLAAIEAKLKLKRLQQNKSRGATSSQRPSSAASTQKSTIQVDLSPTKRAITAASPRSPGRVLLGIDKGKTGADVSLKRAKSASERLGSINSASRADRSSSRASQLSTRSHAAAAAPPKSFSERMAETRDRDRAREQRREAFEGMRSSGFSVDKAEMDGYRALAEESRKHPLVATSSPAPQSFSRADVLRAKQNAESGSRIRKSQTMPDFSQARPSSRGQSSSSSPLHADASLHEPFSGISLSSRVLPHSFLKRTLPEESFKIYTIPDLLQDVTSPEYEIPDGVGDYVVFGIIASKSGALDHKNQAQDQTAGGTDWEQKWDDGSQNQRKFIAMTLTDLEWTVDLYLFGTAVPRYHRLSAGTVVAILNPGIMPPKKGKEDTGAFSLTIRDGDETILEIGHARELAFCSATRKDGKPCGQWVNKTKTEICEFHLNLQLSRNGQGRMGLNGGSNGFTNKESFKYGASNFGGRSGGNFGGGGRNGLLPRKEGQQYDKWTGSSYYVAKSTKPAPVQHAQQPFGGPSASRLLDLDDPFIAEGQVGRDKRAQLQRRQERQKKELEIAEKLGQFKSAGAGAEYMRRHTGTATRTDLGTESSSRLTAEAVKNNIMRSKSDACLKRTGENVRLSPVKKTRFVTERGIKEAGRESLGVTTHDDDDDDDLDIV